MLHVTLYRCYSKHKSHRKSDDRHHKVSRTPDRLILSKTIPTPMIPSESDQRGAVQQVLLYRRLAHSQDFQLRGSSTSGNHLSAQSVLIISILKDLGPVLVLCQVIGSYAEDHIVPGQLACKSPTSKTLIKQFADGSDALMAEFFRSSRLKLVTCD